MLEIRNLQNSMAKLRKNKSGKFPKTHWFILNYIEANSEIDVTMNELSKEFHITKPRVTAIISSLHEDGYVVYKESSEDKRKKIIKLTDKGKSYIEQIHDHHNKFFEKVFSKFDEEEKKQWLLLTKKTTQIINEMIEMEES